MWPTLFSNPPSVKIDHNIRVTCFTLCSVALLEVELALAAAALRELMKKPNAFSKPPKSAISTIEIFPKVTLRMCCNPTYYVRCLSPPTST